MGINERKTIARILGPDMKYAEAKKRKTEFALSITPIEFNEIVSAF
jgi:hypothetical protein